METANLHDELMRLSCVDLCQPSIIEGKMGQISTRRRAYASAVPTRDTPIVYFDTAPASGYGHGIISIALGADCIEMQAVK